MTSYVEIQAQITTRKKRSAGQLPRSPSSGNVSPISRTSPRNSPRPQFCGPAVVTRRSGQFSRWLNSVEGRPNKEMEGSARAQARGRGARP